MSPGLDVSRRTAAALILCALSACGERRLSLGATSRDAQAWTLERSPLRDARAMWASADVLYVVGDGVARLDGAQWTTVIPAGSGVFDRVAGDFEKELFVSNLEGTVVRLQGTIAEKLGRPVGALGQLLGLTVVEGEVWALAGQTLSRWTGATWVSEAVPTTDHNGIAQIQGTLWLLGEEALHARDASGWTKQPNPLPGALLDAWTTDKTAWACGKSGLIRLDGDAWTPVKGPWTALLALAADDLGVLAVEVGGKVVTWPADAGLPSPPVGAQVVDVWSTSGARYALTAGGEVHAYRRDP